METLTVRNISAKNGTFELSKVSFSIKGGEILVVLGQNGSGKTTLLNSIAGFIPVMSGTIELLGQAITNALPEERNIGYIFQNLALFPHRSVKKNILYGTRFKKIEKVKESFDSLVSFFHLQTLLERMPSSLSGGERQKVALARALIVDPKVLLLDEPTSQLSPLEKERVSLEIKQSIKAYGKSAIFVTHSLEEAYIVADRILVLEQGRMLQIGTPEEIFYTPNSQSVAEIGEVNVVQGVVVEADGNLMKIDVNGIYIWVIGEYNKNDLVKVFIRPEEITLSKTLTKTSARNNFEGAVEKTVNRGVLSRIKIRINERVTLNAIVTRQSQNELEISGGKKIYLSFKITSIHSIKM